MTQAIRPRHGSWRLTETGQQRLESGLLVFYGNQLSHSQLARVTNLDRETISRVRNGRHCVRLSSISELFDVCNLDLDETQDCEPCQNQLTRSPRRRPTTSPAPQPPAAKLAQLLWNLDCQLQEALFRKNLDQNSQALAVVIRASNHSIRQWLLKRLVRKLKNSDGAKYFKFDMHSLRRRSQSGLDAIWPDIAQELRISDTPKVVVKGLCNLCATQPVVIVVQSRNRFRDLNTQLWQDFWCPLM
ncbi:MAG: hypothetical protein AAGA83_00180 [Cyanobacteria bacterium P01_F01_bin.116]